MPVEFVTIDGRAIPLHPFGGCSGRNGTTDGRVVRNPDSQCIKTNCAQCGAAVFFIRHNGGSVFIDPPLGPPWNCHSCMPRKQAGAVAAQAQDTFYVSPEARELLTRVRGLITGVVTQAEVLPGQQGAMLTIAVAQSEPLVLLMRSPSTYFLGKMVILRPAKRLLYSAENPTEVFAVERALHVPMPLRNREFPLLLEGSELSTAADDARTAALLDGQPKNVCKAYRKYLRLGLAADWKAHELAAIVHLLDGRKQEEAVHRAAVLTLEKYVADGDCTAALALAKVLAPPNRALLASWFRQFSPIRINLSQNEGKLRVLRAQDGTKLGVELAAAKAAPYFKRLPNAGRR